MERLTTKRKDGRWALRNDNGATPLEQINKIPRAIDRLAAYEDTMPLERAQELAQAEKDGRLVVLPCKVGAPVWEIGDFDGGNLKRRPFSVEDMSFWRFGNTVFLSFKEAEAALQKREADNETD